MFIRSLDPAINACNFGENYAFTQSLLRDWQTLVPIPVSSTHLDVNKRQEQGDSSWVNSASNSHEEQVIKNLLKRVHGERSGYWTKVVADWKGVSEETTTGVHLSLIHI